MSRITQNIIISVIKNSATRRSFCFQNNPKNPDPSYKMDLDIWELF